VIKEAGLNYEPSALATFLYQLAQKYNSFYNKYQILVNDNEIRSFRLTLTQAVKQVLAESLSLLGISAPARM
jgi:arginyl-tRNA synthetase